MLRLFKRKPRKPRRLARWELEALIQDFESDLWLQVEWNREVSARIDHLESQQAKLANDLRELRHKQPRQDGSR